WVNETILRCKTWKYYKDSVPSNPERENENLGLAGEEFFARLKNLSNDQKDTRETYYLCLGLGFRGKYGREPDKEPDKEPEDPRLLQTRHEQAPRLSRPVESVYGIDKITPQPYTVPPGAGKPVTDLWPQWLVKAGYAMVVGIPVVLLMLWFYLGRVPPPVQLQLTVTKGGTGSGTVKSVPEGVNCDPICSKGYASGTVVALQAIPARGSVFSGWGGEPDCKESAITVSTNLTCTAIFPLDAQAIQAAALANQQCAKVSAALDGRVVELSGVTSEAQRADILQSVQSIEGVERVKDTQLRLMPSYF